MYWASLKVAVLKKYYFEKIIGHYKQVLLSPGFCPNKVFCFF